MLNRPVVSNSVPAGLSLTRDCFLLQVLCNYSPLTALGPLLTPGHEPCAGCTEPPGRTAVCPFSRRITAHSCSFSSKRGQSRGQTTPLEAEDKSVSVITGVSLIFLIKRKLEVWNHGSPAPPIRTYIRCYWSEGRFKSSKAQRISSKIM